MWLVCRETSADYMSIDVSVSHCGFSSGAHTHADMWGSHASRIVQA